MSTIRAAAVQLCHAPGDKKANLAKIRTFAEEAASRDVQLLAFPEMCVSGYWHLRKLSRGQLEELAEVVPDGPSTKELLDLSAAHRMTVGAGLIERAADGNLHNTYVVALPDGRWARHRKIHCFISEHMASGSEFTVFEMPEGCRVGVLTCYDNNIGENVRITALLGAEILMAPHQTGGCDSRDPNVMGKVDPALWENREKDPEPIEAEFHGPKGRGWLMRWLPARAHDNGLFLVFANGVGIDDDEVRTGNAMILDPYGRVLAETWKAAETMVVADLDLSLIENSTGRRWIRTRRPSLYAPVARPTGKEEETRKVRFDQTGV